MLPWYIRGSQSRRHNSIWQIFRTCFNTEVYLNLNSEAKFYRIDLKIIRLLIGSFSCTSSGYTWQMNHLTWYNQRLKLEFDKSSIKQIPLLNFIRDGTLIRHTFDISSVPGYRIDSYCTGGACGQHLSHG